jgi:hypothetical protein
MIAFPYHPTDCSYRCSRWPSKHTNGYTRCTVARRMPSDRNVGSTDSSPFISSYKWQGRGREGRKEEMTAVRKGMIAVRKE